MFRVTFEKTKPSGTFSMIFNPILPKTYINVNCNSEMLKLAFKVKKCYILKGVLLEIKLYQGLPWFSMYLFLSNKF